MPQDVRISYAAARVNKGITQEEASKRLGFSVFTLINYESGKTVPNWERHNLMADFYGIPKEMLSSPRK